MTRTGELGVWTQGPVGTDPFSVDFPCPPEPLRCRPTGPPGNPVPTGVVETRPPTESCDLTSLATGRVPVPSDHPRKGSTGTDGHRGGGRD